MNCQQHIHQRFSQRQIAPVIEKLQTRIAELESEVKQLKSNSSLTNDTLTRSIIMQFHKNDTALVVIDPQNDVLSEKGVSWGLVGESIKENNTVENLARLFAAAKDQDYGVFISPHYLYPHDQAWQFGGAVEKMMLEGKEFFRPDPLGRDGFTRLRGGLAGPLQAVHRGRQDGRGQPAQDVGPANQRPGVSTPQTRYQQGHPGGNAGESVR